MSSEYSQKAQKIIENTMREYKRGTLKSGNSSKVVKKAEQAVAIGITKARKQRTKVPSAS